MKDKQKKFQYGNIITISVAHLFHDIYTAFLAPILPLLIEKLGISLSLAGLLDIVRKLPSLLNPVIGVIADKVCVKYFIILAPAITGIAMSLLGIAPSYWLLVVFLLIAGVSGTLFHVPAPVMIKYIAGKRTGMGMSFYMLGGEIARTLGPLLITAAVSWWTLEGSYRLMPLGIITSLFLYIKLRNVNVSDHLNKRRSGTNFRKTFKDLLPFFLILTGIALFRAAMKLSLTLYLPTYLTKQGHSLWLAGISLSILQFSGAAGTLLAGPISDHLGRKNTLLITAIFSPFLMWIFINTSGAWMIPLLILMGFSLFASGPVLLALVQDTDSEHPAFVNSIYMTISFGISAIVVLLIGVLGDKFGLFITYKVCAIISVGTIPFILMLGKK